ncbi:ImmA/IrrE family metallo-endopeptidase [Youngiibacter fragilis]|uniref:IrrE N-terminal-like domain-containing protein n=1 Tax=Youngiibacter fragilis 232.1 TaxID=994573 RepID=V7I2T9_9CLOT|nr:hypothetical protein [Youngiibacter fragilis]ETA80560.1 hypothetical protein T472_0210885 [Youngiibacter fragilis 232.1]
MPSKRSFTDYISSRFYNEFYTAIEKYIEENPNNLGLDLKNVKHIGEISLSEMEVKYVLVRDLPELKIEFDVIVDAEIEVTEGDYHYDDYDLFNKWFLLRCSGDLEHSLDDFAIREISLYSQKNKNPHPLSDSLVPYIKREQLDTAAHDFLKKYYPEALKKPMPLEPEVLAEKMGLEVILRDITEDLSVFGQIFFHDSEAEFYDPDEGECISTSVRARTIFVDPKAYFLRNLGAVNNTIVHECVHWDKHRKAFELERLYNSSATKIKCQVAGGIKNSNKEATDWMEWQANALAPRIQMPLAMFKTKAFEFIKEFRQQSGIIELIDVMEPVIDALATFFCVSRIAAKIRMIDAGFEEAIGTYTYLDGHYVKPHGFSKGSIKINQTFSLSAQDAAIERFINPELRALTDSGDYLFIDNHFVYNSPLYVERDENGRLDLTGYARSHMDECCLVFDMSITSKVDNIYHTTCFLNREPSDITFGIKFHNGFENAPQERQIQMRKKIQAEELEIRKQMTDDPEQCMDLLLAWRKMNYTDLGLEIDRDPKTISRTVKGETNPKVETAALICFGLNLPPVISMKLMEVLGCKLNPMKYPDHQWINEALYMKYPEPIWAVREYLEPYGVEI